MPLSASAMMNVLSPLVGPADPIQDGHLKNYCTGFVKMMTAARIAHAIPGSVLAAAAPAGSPITGGSATAGKIISLVPTIMSSEMAKGGNAIITAGAIKECTQTAAYILGAALINFPTGTVFGQSTATATSPGPLAPDPSKPNAGAGGTISGLAGPAMAAVVNPEYIGPRKIAFYTALCNYVMSSASCVYPVGCVSGTCSPSGQLTAGMATGGTIT